jgi:hypothetical protein
LFIGSVDLAASVSAEASIVEIYQNFEFVAVLRVYFTWTGHRPAPVGMVFPHRSKV